MKKLFLLSALIMLAFTSMAQSGDSVANSRSLPETIALEKAIDNTRIISINPLTNKPFTPQEDSVRWLISRFYVDQYRHFQDPKAPYFMFMSRDAKVAMGIGGVVRMRGWADWNGSISANGFIPYLIDIPKNPTRKRNLSATPAGTALYFAIIGRSSPFGEYMGYIEANFTGYQGLGFKLKKAYVTMGDWTVGYASSSFTDPAAEPPVIDGAGPNGKLSKSAVLVRYLHSIKNHWMVGGSIEFSNSQVANTATTASCKDWFPDVVATAQYSWDGGISHLRAAGLLKVMEYRDLISNSNHNVVGWGAQLSGVFKVIDPLRLYAIANVGQGHASYMGDLSIGQYDLVGDMEKEGKMYAPTALGLTFGAKYYFRYNIYAGLALGEMRYYPKDKPAGDEYKYGLYGAINLFWDITPRFQVGAEYLAGKRMNFNHSHGNANRVDALFQMSF